MGTQHEVCVIDASFCKQVLLALERGVSSTGGICPGLAHGLSQSIWTGSEESAPFMLQGEDVKGCVTVK